MNNILIAGIMFVLLSSLVFALDCSYDTKPYLSKSIDFICTTDNADYSECVGMVLFNESLIHIYPKIRDMWMKGRIQYFTNRNGTKLVNVQFKNDDLYQGMEYEFRIICASEDGHDLEEFAVNLSLMNPEWANIPARGVWIKDNMPVVIFIIIGSIFLFAVIRMIVKG